jgi:hypothetical protein
MRKEANQTPFQFEQTVDETAGKSTAAILIIPATVSYFTTK